MMMDKFEGEVREEQEVRSANRRVNIWSLLFADDNKCSGSSNTVEDTALLQKALDLIYKWTQDNQMRMNSTKTFAMRIGPDKYETSYKAPDGSVIKFKDEIKDLGITLSKDGSYKDHILAIRKKAMKKCGFILRTFTKIHRVNLSLIRKQILG